MWLGAVIGSENDVELRIYFNLRSGSLLERWNKIGSFLSPFISEAVERFMQNTFKKTSIESTAIPVC